MSYRKYFHFKNRRYISISIGRNSPGIHLDIDGGEGTISIGICLWVSLWITICDFFPMKWFPTYDGTFYKNLPTKVHNDIYFHARSIWWHFWHSDDWEQSWKGKKWWRRGCIDFDRMIRGKHYVDSKVISMMEGFVDMAEGSYKVVSVESRRKDSWQRWFWEKKSIRYEVIVGSIKNGSVEQDRKGVPVPGKGTQAWNCDQDATFSITFPINSIVSHGDAINKFRNRVNETRVNRGGTRWVPK